MSQRAKALPQGFVVAHQKWVPWHALGSRDSSHPNELPGTLHSRVLAAWLTRSLLVVTFMLKRGQRKQAEVLFLAHMHLAGFMLIRS